MDELNKIPPVSRFLLLGTLGITVPVILKLISPTPFVLYWPWIQQRFHVWRLVTPFFMAGGGIQLIFDMIALFRSSTALEEGEPFYRSTSTYAWTLTLTNALIILLNQPLGSAVLFRPMLYAITTFWSRAYRSASVNLFGIVNVPAPYLPYTYLVLDVLMGGPHAAITSGTGILAAYAIHYIRDEIPRPPPGSRLASSGSLFKRMTEVVQRFVCEPPLALQRLLPDSIDPVSGAGGAPPSSTSAPTTGNGRAVRSTPFGTAFAPRGRAFGSAPVAPPTARSSTSASASTGSGGGWLGGLFGSSSAPAGGSSSRAAPSSEAARRQAMLDAIERRERAARADSIAGRAQAGRTSTSTQAPTSSAGSSSLAQSNRSSETSALAASANNSAVRRTAASTSQSGANDNIRTFAFGSAKKDDKEPELDASGSGGRVAEERRSGSGDKGRTANTEDDKKGAGPQTFAGPWQQSAGAVIKPTSTPASDPTLYINGKWTHSDNNLSRATVNPFDGSVIAHVSEASANNTKQAIQAARKFFDGSAWPRKSFSSRSDFLLRVADLLQRDREVLAHTEVTDTGKTIGEAYTDVDDVTAVFRYYAEEAKKLDKPRTVTEGVPESVRSQIVAEPVGVPLLQVCWKLAPALVAGNAVIIKPSEVTPLSTIHLVKILIECGYPVGSVQLLTAGGAEIGSVLTESPDVDLVSFTGGLQTGRAVIRSCAETIKRCTVELGGKNPNIVFADVDLDIAIDTVTTAVFVHSGQVCSSGTRLIVEESIADALVAGVVAKARKIVLGNGLDPKAETGPLVSAAHLEKVKAYVDLGKQEGAELLCGGTQPDPKAHPDLSKGFFFLPTVFDKCNRDMEIVKAETFGPILTVERFKDGDEEHAIFLGNDTKYGLAAGVQSKDTARAERVARRLRHGTVWQNTYGAYTPRAEWGGFGLSGNGRELGEKGLDEYIELKHMYTETKPALMQWFKG
ncbi:hypothetical protein OC845_006275 [Tilletia horrida]|nr:hypothetical protein OC845_006275 [Tilletia horrida]